ncbi:TetR/AcrR family transcriptional regulator [Amycolatopsis sp.]|jgi:AcrR family transcriptional regulator|uniref:TetR/AcrR family transcriptional regulator n=1 Tax=Amycolatopsis sp. TaxID=37632 RepID=UPI002E0B8F67|nr:TetR family transcriptional regulator [Amycolatopsis sp.]
MSHSAFLRARSPEHKQQRREAILAAARELALMSGVRNVSLGGVACAVGLAKSNVGRYFGTREEIYLELAAEGWQDWRGAVLERLRDASGKDAVVDALAEPFETLPLFCDLLSQLSTSLEHNISVPAARAFKHLVHDVIADLCGPVVAAYPELSESEARELISGAAAMAGVLYPVGHPPSTILEVYAQDPELAALCPPFLPTLKRFLSAVVVGLPTLR